MQISNTHEYYRRLMLLTLVEAFEQMWSENPSPINFHGYTTPIRFSWKTPSKITERCRTCHVRTGKREAPVVSQQ